jgi:hypothetical protein
MERARDISTLLNGLLIVPFMQWQQRLTGLLTLPLPWTPLQFMRC